MVPMRDGKRMAADIYRPKDASKKYPIIFSRTPYNFNFWDVRLGAPRDMTTILEAVKRGYAYVVMNERGHFFSEGNYDILGAPDLRRRRRDQMDVVAGLVEQKGRHDRLFVDRRMAAGGRRSRKSEFYDDDRAGLRRGHRARRTILRARQLVSRRRGADAFYRVALRSAKSGAPDVSAQTLRRKI